MPGTGTGSSFVIDLVLSFPQRPSEKLIYQGKLFIRLNTVTENSALVENDFWTKLDSVPKRLVWTS